MGKCVMNVFMCRSNYVNSFPSHALLHSPETPKLKT